MATFNDLQPLSYFLLQIGENEPIQLVFVTMTTNKCVLLEMQDEAQTLVWRKKDEPIYEVVEQLTDEQALIYESLFEADDEGDEDWDDDFLPEEDEEEDEFDEELDWNTPPETAEDSQK
jgi:hypothetical protein